MKKLDRQTDVLNTNKIVMGIKRIGEIAKPSKKIT